MQINPVNNFNSPKVLPQTQQNQVSFKGLNVKNVTDKVVQSKSFQSLNKTMQTHPLPFKILLNALIFGSLGFAISKVVNHKKRTN